MKILHSNSFRLFALFAAVAFVCLFGGAPADASVISFGFAGLLYHKLPPVENVAANSTGVLPRIPMGDVYDGLLLDFSSSTAMTLANISNLRINLGGKLIWDITGTHLDNINQYYGFDAYAAQGQLYVWFADPHARTIVGQSLGSIDTSLGYSNFSMEVDLATATAPNLKVFGLKGSPQKGEGRAFFRAMVKAIHAPSAAAEFSLGVPYGSDAGALLRAVHFMDAGGLITQLQVKKDGLYLLEEGKLAVIEDLQDTLGRVPVANHVAWDSILYDNQSDATPTLRPDGTRSYLEFKVTVSGADTITTYTDMYATINML